MKKKIENYVEEKFKNSRKTEGNLDLKNEIISNMQERYEDYLSSGEKAEEAFEKTIVNFGDFDELIEVEKVSPNLINKIKEDRKNQAKRYTAAAGFLVFSNTGGYYLSLHEKGELGYTLGLAVFWISVAIAFSLVAYNILSRDREISLFYKRNRKRLFRRNADRFFWAILFFLFIQAPSSKALWIVGLLAIATYFAVKKFLPAQSKPERISLYQEEFSDDIEQKVDRYQKRVSILVSLAVLVIILSMLLPAGVPYGIIWYWALMAIPVAIFTNILFAGDLEVIEYKRYQKSQNSLNGKELRRGNE